MVRRRRITITDYDGDERPRKRRDPLVVFLGLLLIAVAIFGFSQSPACATRRINQPREFRR